MFECEFSERLERGRLRERGRADRAAGAGHGGHQPGEVGAGQAQGDAAQLQRIPGQSLYTLVNLTMFIILHVYKESVFCFCLAHIG